MTNTVDQAIAWAKEHPTKDVGETDWSWAGWCAALVFWAGDFSRSFMYALDASKAAAPLNPDWRKAPRGAIHYWGGVWISGRENGHTAIDIGNDHTLLMASSKIDTSAAVSDFGNAIGTIKFANYGLPNYLGWSMKWGDETLAGVSATAALDEESIDNTPQGDIMARYLYAPNRGGILVTPADGIFFPVAAGTNEPLAWEHRWIQSTLYGGIEVTDRQWDIARQDALDNQARAGKHVDNAIGAAIIKAFQDVVVEPGSDIDVDEFATVLAIKLAERGFGAEIDVQELAKALLNKQGEALAAAF